MGRGEESAALLLSGEAVWHVAVESEGGRVEGGVEGVLAAGVAAVQGVAHEAADAVGHCIWNKVLRELTRCSVGGLPHLTQTLGDDTGAG